MWNSVTKLDNYYLIYSDVIRFSLPSSLFLPIAISYIFYQMQFLTYKPHNTHIHRHADTDLLTHGYTHIDTNIFTDGDTHAHIHKHGPTWKNTRAHGYMHMDTHIYVNSITIFLSSIAAPWCFFLDRYVMLKVNGSMNTLFVTSSRFNFFLTPLCKAENIMITITRLLNTLFNVVICTLEIITYTFILIPISYWKRSSFTSQRFIHVNLK